MGGASAWREHMAFEKRQMKRVVNDPRDNPVLHFLTRQLSTALSASSHNNELAWLVKSFMHNKNNMGFLLDAHMLPMPLP